jgi:Fur family ferric uptake transcriptional regulator
LGTVYRNLEVLSECGEILKLEFAGKQRRFDGDVARHSHLRCMACGAVEDIRLPGIEIIEHELDKFVGGRVRSAHVEISGYCQLCASRLGIAYHQGSAHADPRGLADWQKE